MDREPLTALLIENEPSWESRLLAVLREQGITEVRVLRTYAEAERELRDLDLLPFAFAVVDVRMRKQLFDQGGLALLHLLKSRRPALPVLVLSAYFDDYPGLKKVTSRYTRVLTCEKENFANSSGSVLEHLLGKSTPYDVFISYRREAAADLAHLLRIALQKQGCRVFLDVRALRPGPFDVALLKSIEETRNFVVLLTPGCLDRCVSESDWFRKEIAHAIRTGRRIIPVQREGFEFPSSGSLPLDIAPLTTQHCTTYSNDFTDEVIARLYEMLEL
jgi:hypothetical protein